MEIKRGNTSFNVEAFIDWNKNQFLLQYCGIVKGVNLSEVWEEIQKLLGNDTKSDKGFGEKAAKKSKSKRDNETSIPANEFPQTDN